MCGIAPAVVGVAAARSLGADSGDLVAYANSGDVTGDFERVVAYAGVVFS
jgi:AmmeMemoRadiSam system protein B